MQWAVCFALDNPETPVEVFLTFQAKTPAEALSEFHQALDQEKHIFNSRRTRRVFCVLRVWGRS